jgi:hypothetical protein
VRSTHVVDVRVTKNCDRLVANLLITQFVLVPDGG